MENSRIKIAIFGQVRSGGGADDTKVVYTFPNPNSVHLNEPWLRGLFDPREPRELTEKDTYCIWSNDNGYYYGLIVPANDGRNGRLLLCIHVGNKISTNGSIVLSTLNTLKTLLIDNEVREPNVIASNTNDLVNSLVTEQLPHSSVAKPSAKGVRQYDSDSSLKQILTYPKQDSYRNYRYIFIVPSSVSVNPGSDFQLITTPIKKIYRVQGNIPEGVQVDKYTIEAGRTINITYGKQGCEPVTKTITVDGCPNSVIFYVENELYVNDAQKAGIQFYRKLMLRFEDASTHSSVNGVKILFNGKPTTSYELTFKDQASYNTYRISVSKTGYVKAEVEITGVDIFKGEKTISLEPKISRQTLYVRIPDESEDTPINVELPETSALYRYVQQYGTRLKIKSNNRSRSPHEEDDDHKGYDWWQIIEYVLYGIIALLLLYGVYTAYQLVFTEKAPWPFGKEQVEDAQVVDSTETDEKISLNALSPEDKQADLDYLKENDIWDKTKIKTDSLRTLFDFIAKGQVNDAISHPYQYNTAVNGFWAGKKGIIKIV